MSKTHIAWVEQQQDQDLQRVRTGHQALAVQTGQKVAPVEVGQ